MTSRILFLFIYILSRSVNTIFNLHRAINIWTSVDKTTGQVGFKPALQHLIIQFCIIRIACLSHCFSVNQVLFSFNITFNIFPLFLVFRSLIIRCLGKDFFRFIPFVWVSYQIWEVFRHYFLKYFSALPTSSSP